MKSDAKTRFSSNHAYLLSYEELPHYRKLQENIYIKQGYHPPPKNWIELWNLLWSIHSETINIWSHMMGALLFLYFFINTVLFDKEDDHWVTIFFDLAAFTTFTLSALYHWLRICSSSYDDTCCFLDHIGIELIGYATGIRFTSYFFDLNDDLFYSYSLIHT